MSGFLQQFLQQDASPIVQFIKYAIGGAVATGVDMLVFFFVAWKLLPALREDDPLARRLRIRVSPVDDMTRSRRFIWITAIAFLFSNLTAYLINIVWVFKAGRYAWYVELGLFYAVSGISIVIGTFLGWSMIRFLRLSTTFSYVGKLIAALMINYVCRKYFIFNG